MTIKYSKACNTEQKLVNKFFKRNKTNVSCNQQDLVFFASDSNQEIVAAVLIRTATTDINLFRSLFVEPSHRGEGIANALCNFALREFEGTCFTLCKKELVGFYQKLDFTLSGETPPHSVFERQIKKGLLLMRRP